MLNNFGPSPQFRLFPPTPQACPGPCQAIGHQHGLEKVQQLVGTMVPSQSLPGKPAAGQDPMTWRSAGFPPRSASCREGTLKTWVPNLLHDFGLGFPIQQETARYLSMEHCLSLGRSNASRIIFLDPCLLAASVTMTTKRLLYAISLTCRPLWAFKDFATLITPVSCCLIIQIKLEKGGAEALDDALTPSCKNRKSQ